MLKQQPRLIAAAVFVLDLTLVAVAFVVAWWLRSRVLPELASDTFPQRLYPLSAYLPLLPIALGIWAFCLVGGGRYRSHRTIALSQEVGGVIRTNLAGAVLFALAIFAFRLDVVLPQPDRISRAWLFLFVVGSTLLLISEKLTLRLTSRWVRAQGYNYRTVLIVGTNETAAEIARSIQSHGDWGYKIIGCVHGDDEPAHPWLPRDIPILGSVEDVGGIVEQTVVDDVFFALPRRNLERLENLFLGLQQQGIRTRFALNLLPHGSSRIELEELDGMPLLSFSPTPTNLTLLALKRITDISLSVLVLLIGLPIIFCIALLVKATSSGGVLYKQTRCGLNGRRFTLYKFRTMVENADERRRELQHLNEMDGPVFKLRRDPRVTRVGRILRKFSLDELPQLWNVLRGDMSLVGPRPPIPEEVAEYTRWQRRRLSMKPGLTCLWQISGRSDVDFDRWIELDLEYIDSWSPSLDFKILLKTIPVVLMGRGAF